MKLCDFIFELAVLVIYLCFQMYFSIGHHCMISSLKQNCLLFIHHVNVMQLFCSENSTCFCYTKANKFSFSWERYLYFKNWQHLTVNIVFIVHSGSNSNAFYLHRVTNMGLDYTLLTFSQVPKSMTTIQLEF